MLSVAIRPCKQIRELPGRRWREHPRVSPSSAIGGTVDVADPVHEPFLVAVEPDRANNRKLHRDRLRRSSGRSAGAAARLLDLARRKLKAFAEHALRIGGCCLRHARTTDIRRHEHRDGQRQPDHRHGWSNCDSGLSHDRHLRPRSRLRPVVRCATARLAEKPADRTTPDA